MDKIYKFKHKNTTYETMRRSNIFLAKICILILYKRRIQRFLKRTMRQNKIIIYMLFMLILLYLFFFFIDTFILNNRFESFLIYLWQQKEIFVSSVITVLFLNIIKNIEKRRTLLQERFDICSNIQTYFNDFLELLNYNKREDLKQVDMNKLLEKIVLLDYTITYEQLKEVKENTLKIIDKTYIIKQLGDYDGYIEEEYIRREINSTFHNNKRDLEKIETILWIYSNLFTCFYAVWNQDNHINKIIEAIFY